MLRDQLQIVSTSAETESLAASSPYDGGTLSRADRAGCASGRCRARTIIGLTRATTSDLLALP